MSSPIHKKNAIEVMGFIVTFEQPFNPATCEKFLGLKELLASEFPTFNRTNNLAINVKGNQQIEPSESVTGVLLQNNSSTGKPNWQLRVQGNNIIALCFSYDRWKEESDKAVSYILKAASSVPDDNPVVLVALQTVDTFNDNFSTYCIDGVLNPKSKYLTSQVLEADKLWHIHQGWFEKNEDNIKCLNVLKLSTTEIPDMIATVIDHNVQMIFEGGKSNEYLQRKLVKILGNLHERNKEIVRELLNEKQKDRIGL